MMLKHPHTLLGAVLFSATLAFSGTALASHHEAEVAGEDAHHGPSFDIKTFGLQLLNFGVLAGILIVFGGKAINKALAQRHETMKADLAEAGRLRAEAEAKLKQQEARLANLETELARLRANLKQEAEAEKARVIAAAEEKVRRVQHETQFLLDQQVKEAELRFRSEVAAAAARVAEEIVRRQVGPADLTRLATTFAAEVEASAKPAAGVP